MAGHRGRHANCHTQGKMSSTPFQPSCSLSSSSSSLQGHKNSSPWISCLHLLFRPRKGGDPISFSETTSSWKHYHRGRQPSHLPLIHIHSRSRENRLKSSKLVNDLKKKSYPAYMRPSCSELIMCRSHSQRHLSSWNKAEWRCPLMHYVNQTTRQLHSSTSERNWPCQWCLKAFWRSSENHRYQRRKQINGGSVHPAFYRNTTPTWKFSHVFCQRDTC